MKKGYTIIEILMCLGCLSAVVLGAFVLYGQYTSELVDQTINNNESYAETELFLALNHIIQSAYYINQEGNNIDLGNNTISINGDTLYINDKPVYSSDNGLYLSTSDSREVYLDIGGKQLCFRSISTEIYPS